VRPIAVTVDATNHDVPADVAVPIGIIVNELVTNSLKYAFPHEQSGTISVKFHQDGEYIVTVEDNGVGCDTEPKGLGTTLYRLHNGVNRVYSDKVRRLPGQAVFLH